VNPSIGGIGLMGVFFEAEVEIKKRLYYNEIYETDP